MTYLDNSILIEKTSNYLGSKLNFNNPHISSYITFSTLDLFRTANSQILNEKKTNPDSLKLYSPFNDYFGLVNIIKTTDNTFEIDCKMAMRPNYKIIGQDGFSGFEVVQNNLSWTNNTLPTNITPKQNNETSKPKPNDNGYRTIYPSPKDTTEAVWSNSNIESPSYSTSNQMFNSLSWLSPTLMDPEKRISQSSESKLLMLPRDEHLHMSGLLGSGLKVQSPMLRCGDDEIFSDVSSVNNLPLSGRSSISSLSSSTQMGGLNPNASEDPKFQRHRRVKLCVFCRNNGEPENVYKSHILKDSNGKVTCPVLRAYTCPTCGASGNDAHTLKYCPATQPTIIYSPGFPDNGNIKW